MDSSYAESPMAFNKEASTLSCIGLLTMMQSVFFSCVSCFRVYGLGVAFCGCFGSGFWITAFRVVGLEGFRVVAFVGSCSACMHVIRRCGFA